MNQLCKVCGEPAAGYHFGAFTCEGCKSFFGRTYNNLSALGDCKNSGQCVINKKNRTSCKSCRLKKCLTVGMSKSGSRYGRRSNWFKIHCLIQDQADQMNANNKLGNSNCSEAKRMKSDDSIRSSPSPPQTRLPAHRGSPIASSKDSNASHHPLHHLGLSPHLTHLSNKPSRVSPSHPRISSSSSPLSHSSRHNLKSEPSSNRSSAPFPVSHAGNTTAFPASSLLNPGNGLFHPSLLPPHLASHPVLSQAAAAAGLFDPSQFSGGLAANQLYHQGLKALTAFNPFHPGLSMSPLSPSLPMMNPSNAATSAAALFNSSLHSFGHNPASSPSQNSTGSSISTTGSSSSGSSSLGSTGSVGKNSHHATSSPTSTTNLGRNIKAESAADQVASAAALFKSMVHGLGLDPKLFGTDFLSYATLLQQQQQHLAQMEQQSQQRQKRISSTDRNRSSVETKTKNNKERHHQHHHHHRHSSSNQRRDATESSPTPASLSSPCSSPEDGSSSPVSRSSNSASIFTDLPEQEKPIDLTVKMDSDAEDEEEDGDNNSEDEEEKEIEIESTD